MPWKECTMDNERKQFILLAIEPGVNISQLCRDFGISRTTGYKWLNRYQEGGVEALKNRSRRPHRSPSQTDAKTEKWVMAARKENPDWGGRKIKKILEEEKKKKMPAASTITEIIRRHDGIDPEEAKKHRAFRRFEMAAPNMLWQMDFKGYYSTLDGQRCHPLTVLDDHSRYLLGLQACDNQKAVTVKEELIDIFRLYGLPQEMLMDNGTPWSGCCYRCYTKLSAWLLRLDISVIFSKPKHPQTLGKAERFHRTLKTELLKHSQWLTVAACQPDYDQWRQVYNHIRPHEALQLEVPADRYHPSLRPYPEQLPPVVYESGKMLRKVDISGKISLHGHSFNVGKAFKGEYVAIEETDNDGVFDVYFCKHRVKKVDIRE